MTIRRIPEKDLEIILVRHGGELQSGLRNAFFTAARESFGKPTLAFAEGLQVLAQRWTMFEVLGVDPELVRLKRGALRGTRLFLDSNILFAVLCKSSHEHEATKLALDATKTLAIEFAVFDFTVMEFMNAIALADRQFADWREGKTELKIEDSEIIRTFRDFFEGTTDWRTYVDMLADGISAFEREYGVRVEDTSKLTLDDAAVQNAKELIRKRLVAVGKFPNFHLVSHDARALVAVQEIRRLRESTGICTDWFLTRQQLLVVPDLQLTKHMFRAEYQASVTLEAWLQIIRPFLGPEIDQAKVSLSFATMIGGSLLPVNLDLDVGRFAKWVAPLLGLGSSDDQHLTRLIKRHPLKSTHYAARRTSNPRCISHLGRDLARS